MPASDRLVSRVRAEYLEMPGLKLTLPQACRLWQLDANTCQAILKRLVDERFLHCTAEGSYMMFPTIRTRTVKALAPSQQMRHHA